MKRTLSSAVIAFCFAGAVGLGGAYAQSAPNSYLQNAPGPQQAASIPLNVPTVVVTVTQFLPLTLSSPASYQLYSGGSMVTMDVNGGLTVNGPTEIRFIVQGADGTKYNPVGINFKQVSNYAGSGSLDPLGHLAFPTRTFTTHGNATQLSVFDTNVAPADFEYDLVIQRSDGALGLIDPPVKNSGGNMNK